MIHFDNKKYACRFIFNNTRLIEKSVLHRFNEYKDYPKFSELEIYANEEIMSAQHRRFIKDNYLDTEYLITWNLDETKLAVLLESSEEEEEIRKSLQKKIKRYVFREDIRSKKTLESLDEEFFCKNSAQSFLPSAIFDERNLVEWF